jgi:tRNA pseudouridine32 synthase/23S rRNA pseudouridine746 synthase
MDILPSIATLPPDPPEGVTTVLDYMAMRFPHIERTVWAERFRTGKVLRASGPIGIDATFEARLRVRYFREPEREWPVRTDFSIIAENEDLLVADKPPFLPVTPAGGYARNCLLHLLIEKTGNTNLAPLHRIDKDAAGLVIFSKRLKTRSHFARLFRQQKRGLAQAQQSADVPVPAFAADPRGHGHLLREYEAICELPAEGAAPPRRLEDHIARSPEQFFRQIALPHEPPNAVCHVEKIEEFKDRKSGTPRALLRIRTETGRKHQIRVQLSSRGFPIVNDRIYGSDPFHDPQSIENPMQLICRRIAIVDYPSTDSNEPINREWISKREFEE